MLLLPLIVLVAACEQSTMPTISEDVAFRTDHQADFSAGFDLESVNINSEVAAQLSEVRRLTAPFHNYQRAERAGWFASLSPCVAYPELGGMGYHIGNPEYLQNGILDPLKPEVLLYEPQKNGRMRLVGVEYIVPFMPPAEPEGQPDPGDQPSLFGQDFVSSPHVGPFGSWTLHVWLWRHNPAGMFADFNPNVSCEYSSSEE